MMWFTGLQTALVVMIPILAVTTDADMYTTKPGCSELCGNVTIPFPFGSMEGCYLNSDFFVNCSRNAGGETVPLWMKSNIIIKSISLISGQLTMMQYTARDCYNRSRARVDYSNPRIILPQFAAVSNTANKFFVVGCYTTGSVSGWRFDERLDRPRRFFRTGCTASCSGEDDVENGTCTGLGCCATSIPRNVRRVNITMRSSNNVTNVSSFNECGYAFVVEESWFAFSLEKLGSLRSVRMVPMVVDWAIGGRKCAEAKAESATYGCKSFNSECYEVDNGFGYRCNCTQGYHGNPYLDGGCRDVDECKEEWLHICKKSEYCHNTNGSFSCVCPKGYSGDGTREGEGCHLNNQSKSESIVFRLAAGISLGIIVLLLSACWFYFVLQNRRLIKMRHQYFHQNGGMLLQQKLHGTERSPDLAKIYSEFDLKRATNNFHSSMIVGEGGYDTVYQGFLQGGGVVAIKKAKQVPKQIDQFTNEVILLSQIKHKNVVKLLGCCLETEFPLLVYEFISNGTLSHHVHSESRAHSFSWDSRLRIAAEVASVLSYLHSDAASTPIIHRDVKCENILLDHSFTAKVTDFGASRLVPLDPSEMSTMMQGTFGYLDPEYMQTNQLNEKSDVYSFGVVLVELLTGMRALSYDRPEAERNLANLFVMKKDIGDLFGMLEDSVVREGREEEVVKVCEVARRCLKVRGEERPSMKEVAVELEGVRGGGGNKHSWIRRENVEEDEECLLAGSGKRVDGLVNGNDSSSFGFDSLRDDSVMPLDGGR